MIDPTDIDIGKSVIYDAKTKPEEKGFITSFNSQYVFVRFGGDHISKGCRRQDLEWDVYLMRAVLRQAARVITNSPMVGDLQTFADTYSAKDIKNFFDAIGGRR